MFLFLWLQFLISFTDNIIWHKNIHNSVSLIVVDLKHEVVVVEDHSQHNDYNCLNIILV